MIQKLTTEGACSPRNDDSFGGAHVSVGLYCLAKSPNLTVSGTHVVHAVLGVWFRRDNRVAGLKDA